MQTKDAAKEKGKVSEKTPKMGENGKKLEKEKTDKE